MKRMDPANLERVAQVDPFVDARPVKRDGQVAAVIALRIAQQEGLGVVGVVLIQPRTRRVATRSAIDAQRKRESQARCANAVDQRLGLARLLACTRVMPSSIARRRACAASTSQFPKSDSNCVGSAVLSCTWSPRAATVKVHKDGDRTPHVRARCQRRNVTWCNASRTSGGRASSLTSQTKWAPTAT